MTLQFAHNKMKSIYIDEFGVLGKYLFLEVMAHANPSTLDVAIENLGSRVPQKPSSARFLSCLLNIRSIHMNHHLKLE